MLTTNFQLVINLKTAKIGKAKSSKNKQTPDCWWRTLWRPLIRLPMTIMALPHTA